MAAPPPSSAPEPLRIKLVKPSLLATSASSSSLGQQRPGTPQPDSKDGIPRRARGPLGLGYQLRGAWYPPPPPPAPPVPDGKKRKSIAKDDEDPPPQLREFRQVLFAPWSQHTLRSFGITAGMVASRRLEPWQERWATIVKEYAAVVAICCSDSVTLLRLGPQQPNKVVLKLVEPGDEILCVAWSFDPIRLMPLLAFAGRKGLIYIWRLSVEPGQGAERFRVLRGHGEEIYSLKFHHSSPHILASTSLDTTARVWNVLGAEAEPDAYKVPATATGDEGPAVLAIYAGQMPGGHTEGVTTAAFHPTLPLLVTGGLDYVLKIWPVPRLPQPKDRPSEHRTYVCYHPLFSSRFLHDGPVNGVEWHGEDTLLSFQNAPGNPRVTGADAGSRLVKWRWLGLRRHFPRDKATGKVTVRYGEHNGKGGLEATASQYASNNAKSYHVLNVYESPEGERPLLPSEPLERPLRPAWFATFAHVLPFPSPNPGRAGSEVSTSLVAMPIRGGRVCVWNPDSVSKHRPVPPVAFRAGSEVEKQEKAQALALALAAAPPPIARPPPPPQAILPPRRPFVPGEVIDVDMSDDDAAAEVEVKSQLIHSAVPPPSPAPKPPAVRPGRFAPEPYSVVDHVGNGDEEEELTSVTVAPGGAKWMVASSARGVHVWSLPI